MLLVKAAVAVLRLWLYWGAQNLTMGGYLSKHCEIGLYWSSGVVAGVAPKRRTRMKPAMGSTRPLCQLPVVGDAGFTLKYGADIPVDRIHMHSAIPVPRRSHYALK